MNSFFDESVTLELNRAGALALLAFLEADQNEIPKSHYLKVTRDQAAFALQNRLYPESVLGDFLTSEGLVAG
jgi:hypothetical protein